MTIHILSLETSSSLCGVALLSDEGERPLLRIAEHDATAEHAERLLPMADKLLLEAGIERKHLNAVAFGQGPGGFTGLRVACGVAQGIAFALGIPVIQVPSLQAVAARDAAQARSGAPTLHIVIQDARMHEVYLAAYRLTGQANGDGAARHWETFQPPMLLDVDDVALWLDAVVAPTQQASRLVGDALQAYPDLNLLPEGRPWLELGQALRADAATVARLALEDWRVGRLVRPDDAAPLYVRDKVAFTTQERERGAGGNPRASAAAPLKPHPLQVTGQTDLRPDAAPLPNGYALDAMRDQHLDDVAEIERSVQSHPWSRGNFADGLKAGYCAWVVLRDREVTGFSMMMLAPDVAHLLVIAVQPAQQGRGAGAMLLRRCESEAAARGLPSIMLEVRPSNENALRFYESHGYRLIGTRKDYYPAGHGGREDAYVMQKSLRAEAPAASGERGAP